MARMKRLTAPAVRWCFWTLLVIRPWAMAADIDSDAGVAPSAGHADPAEFAAWIAEMKSARRGPFQGIRWFCADGTVLPAQAACGEHGRGRQHGLWSERTVLLRQAGYTIGNVLAALDVEAAARDSDPLGPLPFILLERYLIAVDDGWILRRARYYRGAFQIEGEQRQARALLEHLVADRDVLERRFLPAIEIARRLPLNLGNDALLAEIRNRATAIEAMDPEFETLRNKLHSQIDAGDADRVRAFRAALPAGATELRDALQPLAEMLSRLHDRDTLRARLSEFAARFGKPQLQALAQQLNAGPTARQRFLLLGDLATMLRGLLDDMPNSRLTLISMLTQVEQLAFITGGQITDDELAVCSRRELLALARQGARILYGSGLLTDEELAASETALRPLVERPAPPITLAEYRRLLTDLSRLPLLAERRVKFFFAPAAAKLAEIEPLADGFINDRLRGSVLQAYADILAHLQADVAELSGIRHEMFGTAVNAGLRALNPGRATGVLHTPASWAAAGDRDEAILIVAETTADVPPVAGLITAFEGNRLSHVQLLAANLGVPNIVADVAHLNRLTDHVGERVTLRVSPGGVIVLESSSEAAKMLSPTPEAAVVAIRIPIDKLDLDQRLPLTLEQLSAADSGVIAGPKAAKVAELADRYPGRVAPGIVLPFGVFRAVLDRPRPDGVTWFDWLRAQYTAARRLADDARRDTERAFLGELRDYLSSAALDADLESRLRQMLRAQFGPDGGYGVFVRSDTNVEDLPGFIGAGLNLTVPNVVGEAAIIDAIRRVWASPFTERAFGWRQGRMDLPEHVYVSVLVQRSVPADVSGVMVTADMFGRQSGGLSIVVNEGVGGGVEGQAAESWLLLVPDGQRKLMSSAAAPWKRILLPAGGLRWVPASGASRLLSDTQLAELVEFSRGIGTWFAGADATDEAPVADIEFGYHNGRLMLFQIRPYVASADALHDPELIALDRALIAGDKQTVDLAVSPRAARVELAGE